MSQSQSGLVALRATRLAIDGTIADSASGGWALTDPVKLDLSFEYDNGQDIVQRAGNGKLCFTRRRSDELKNATVKFETCGGNPKLIELILNGPGSTVTVSATVTGFILKNAACDSAARAGIFLEWWTETWVCNALDTIQYVRHFLPLVIANYDGGGWDEGRHAFAFTGVANANRLDTSPAGPGGDITGFGTDPFLYGFQSAAATEADIPAASTTYIDNSGG